MYESWRIEQRDRAYAAWMREARLSAARERRRLRALAVESWIRVGIRTGLRLGLPWALIPVELVLLWWVLT